MLCIDDAVGRHSMVEYAHGVGVAKGTYKFNFFAELLFRRGADLSPASDQLDGGRSTQQAMARQIGLTHPTFANFSLELVMTELLGGSNSNLQAIDDS